MRSLDGVVLEDKGNSKIKPQRNLLKDAKPELRNATLKGKELIVNQENGGITYKLDKKKINKYKDLYVTLSIESKTATDYHYVWINEIYQSRKPLNDDYRRFNPVITLKIKATDLIDLKLKTGTYDYKLLGIYGEDYQHLKEASKIQIPIYLRRTKTRWKLHSQSIKRGYVVIPIPFLEGMTAKVDGKDAQISEGNYLMTAVKVDADAKHITIKYTPPYFHLMQIISVIGMLLTFLYIRYLNKQS